MGIFNLKHTMIIEIDKETCMKDLWYRGEYIENDVIHKFEIFNPEIGDTEVIWENSNPGTTDLNSQILKQFFEQ